MTEPSLAQLRKEITKLQREKQRKMALAQTMVERNKLLNEIGQLEQVKQSPNSLKSFGRTFGRGLKITGKTIWSGIKTASRNLDRNAPEFRELSRGMTPKGKITSPMDLYVPKAQTHYSKTPRKMKVAKLQKSKKPKMKKIRRVMKVVKVKNKVNNPMLWEMP